MISNLLLTWAMGVHDALEVVRNGADPEKIDEVLVTTLRPEGRGF